MNSGAKMMNDEFCIKNAEFCSKTADLCIELECVYGFTGHCQ